MSRLTEDWERSPPPNAPFTFSNGRSPLDLWLGGVTPDEAAAAAPLRFHLWELMVTITVAAVLLALFRAMGIVGAALAFLAALLFTNLVYPRPRPHGRPRCSIFCGARSCRSCVSRSILSCSSPTSRRSSKWESSG